MQDFLDTGCKLYAAVINLRMSKKVDNFDQCNRKLTVTLSSMAQLFYYLAPLQNDTIVTSRCCSSLLGTKAEKGREKGKRASALG